MQGARRGFTLVEIMVALAVFGLIMGSAVGIFFSVEKAWQRQRSMLDVIQNARWVLEFMTNELRPADESTITDDPGGIAIGRGVRFGPGGSRVCYWRGDTASDTTSNGATDRLYRGAGNNVNQAYSVRQPLAMFVVDNPDYLNNTTGALTPDGLADPLFIYLGASRELIMEVTVRQYPAQPASSSNPDYTFRTKVKIRGD